MEEMINRQLSEAINQAVLPLITSDYVLWGLPYYLNPGDTLIWEGTLRMLDHCTHKCLGNCGWDEYKYVSLPKDTVILIIGGGYFGDLWRPAWKQVMDTLRLYPENPIIILPQSIHYEDPSLAREDSEILKSCKNLTICARDDTSFEFASKTFWNPVILVPDMAFHVDTLKLKKWARKSLKKDLLLTRADKESSEGSRIIDIQGDIDRTDWPSMTQSPPDCIKFVMFLYRSLKKRSRIKVFRIVEQWLMLHIQKNLIIRDSVRFISGYDRVYSTRLHAMILSFLLGKEVRIIDNSYGKISACYRTWLPDIEKIKIYE